ncbi:MAG: diacylglycerol kinase family lipid kinase [Chlorobi bacterium]|nr:diacylglycerol kinase family lipid kinase [Chlorobiota bacterium]
MSDKKILFVINPVSGTGKQKKLEKIISSKIDKNKFETDIKYTEYAGHAIKISEDAAGKYDAVIIAGGDGSVNEAAQSLINTGTALGIIPAGSGNGFARHLKLPLKPEKAIETINNCNIKTIDTAELNRKPFVNIAGVGFDADMGYAFANIKKRGFSGYAKVILSSLNKIKGKHYKIIVNEKEISGRFFIIAFANGSQYGLNAKISPFSDISDGKAEIVAVKHFPFILTPFLALRLFTGSIHKSKYTRIFRANKLTIVNDKKIFAHIDGEPLELSENINIKLIPDSLKVIAP